MRIQIEQTLWGFHVKMSDSNRAVFDDLLEMFKDTVPKNCRQFKPDSGYWFVERRAERYLDRWIIQIERQYGPLDSEGKDEPKQERHRQESRAERQASDLERAYEVLHLRKSAPLALVRAARKTLARKHHPDRANGSEELMKQVNAAADVIEKQLEASR